MLEYFKRFHVKIAIEFSLENPHDDELSCVLDQMKQYELNEKAQRDILKRLIFIHFYSLTCEQWTK